MRDKLIELIIDGFRNCTKPHEVCSQLDLEAFADYLIAHGVTIATDTNVGDKKPLTIAESADLERIRISIKQKIFDMAQPGMWERCTRHMECGEIRELAQYYRDMGLVYKLITGYEPLWPPKEVARWIWRETDA